MIRRSPEDRSSDVQSSIGGAEASGYAARITMAIPFVVSDLEAGKAARLNAAPPARVNAEAQQLC